MHKRTLIRQAVIERLKDIPEIKGRIFDSPINTIDPSDMPCLTVSLEDQKTEAVSAMSNRRKLKHHATLLVIAFGAGMNKPEDACEGILAQVEDILYKHRFLGDLLLDLVPAKISPFRDGTGDTPVVGVQQIFSISYNTIEGLAVNSIEGKPEE